MIEVEKKFSLKEGNEEKLIANAEFLGEKEMTDVYYDDFQYSLAKKDTWLRLRDGRFELKVSMHEVGEKPVTHQYREIEDDALVATHLKLDPTIPLVDALHEAGYVPFCRLVTTRRKYKKDGFSIDIDSVDFGYQAAEVELMVEDASQMNDASDRIVAYARSLGLTGGKTNGKVKEYLRRNDQIHFQMLVDAGVFSVS
jgi:predicted adenylyl cyclase CyaB